MDSGIWKALSFAIMVAIIVLVGYKEFFKQRLLEETDEDDKNIQKIENSKENK